MNNRSIFDGKNGADELSVTLIVLGVISYLAYPVFTVNYLQYGAIVLAIALVAWGIFRAFSSNLVARRRENNEFVNFFKDNPDKKAEKERKKAEAEAEKARKERRKEDLKTHVYYKCPKCGQELRVPRGKGKIRIRCPKCGEQFERTT